MKKTRICIGNIMLLIDVKDDKVWLFSRWNLTYRCGWEQILKGLISVYDYYEQMEILVNDKVLDIKDKNDIMNIGESNTLTFRGISTILKVPVMITFYNQLQAVDVNVAKVTKEFEVCDYQKFNVSMGQYMDSIELAMF